MRLMLSRYFSIVYHHWIIKITGRNVYVPAYFNAEAASAYINKYTVFSGFLIKICQKSDSDIVFT